MNVPAGTVYLSVDEPTGRTFRDRLLAGGRVHEPGVVAYLCHRLKPDSLFVDVGAHIGYFSCIAGRAGATVVAIEMQRPLGTEIMRNAHLNDLTHVHAMEMAAGDREGVVRSMQYDPALGTKVFEGTDTFRNVPDTLHHRNVDLVPMMRLDSLFAGQDRTPDLIKIDAEGYEFCVLDGAEDLLEARRTEFIVEVHVGQDTMYTPKKPDLNAYFDPATWIARDLTVKGAPVMSGDEIRALSEPGQPTGANPNILFTPRASLP